MPTNLNLVQLNSALDKNDGVYSVATETLFKDSPAEKDLATGRPAPQSYAKSSEANLTVGIKAEQALREISGGQANG